MPTLTLNGLDPCPQCGWVSTWIKVASFRVNKRSLRQTTPGLIAHATHNGCPECGYHMAVDAPPARWALKGDDRKTVDEARRRRGWA